MKDKGSTIKWRKHVRLEESSWLYPLFLWHNNEWVWTASFIIFARPQQPRETLTRLCGLLIKICVSLDCKYNRKADELICAHTLETDAPALRAWPSTWPLLWSRQGNQLTGSKHIARREENECKHLFETLTYQSL